jgi:16S rRNA (cytidine1402-2'-O)-methyltransferase
VAEVCAQLAERERIRGEMVVLVEARPGASIVSGDEPVATLVERLMKEGLSEKDALKRAARERGMGKSEVYREWTRRPGRRTAGA